MLRTFGLAEHLVTVILNGKRVNTETFFLRSALTGSPGDGGGDDDVVVLMVMTPTRSCC